MKTAHYFATRANKLVIISNDTRPQGITVKVNSKKEAKEVAKQHNATPWNF
jgi:ribosomal protein L7Ae-like RNA K-turn-binding protein